jgi:hypothetical protein
VKSYRNAIGKLSEGQAKLAQTQALDFRSLLISTADTIPGRKSVDFRPADFAMILMELVNLLFVNHSETQVGFFRTRCGSSSYVGECA